MTSESTARLFDLFGFFRALTPPSLEQPILPGWFGVTINAANSTAPETEQRILARDSYGRQIGRLMDATALLIEQTRNDDAPLPKAYEDLLALKARIDATKAEAALDRLKGLDDDLDHLKSCDPEAYAALITHRAKTLK